MAQIPSNEEIPSNSQKSRMTAPNEQIAKPKTEKPPLPQFGGVGGAKRKEPSKFALWLRKMFLSDRKPKDILMSVVEDQIVPGFKDNLRNSFVSSIDMFIYQGAKTVSQSNSSNHVSYNSMYQKQQANKMSSAPKTNQNETDENKSNNSFSNPTFKFRSNTDPNNIGAEQFLAEIQSRQYPTFSVMDLYSMRGQTIGWTWDAWGWNREELMNLKIVRISGTDRPWMIEFPPAHVISD